MENETTTTEEDEKPKASDETLLEELTVQYDSAEAALKETRDNSDFPWTDREKMFMGGKNSAQLSSVLKSKIQTQELNNLVIDMSCRVMAQFPTGKIQALDTADMGKNVLMNLAVYKYIIPNANAQHDFMTKLRMADMYSLIYGYQPILVTWRVDEDYVGPDIYLIHPRHFRPQAGAVSLQTCDYVFVDTFQSKDWLEKKSKQEGSVWKNIPELLEKIEESSNGREDSEVEDMTEWEQNHRQALSGAKGKYSQIALTTRYERDRWVTFDTKHKIVIRDIPNPNKDGELPIVVKETLPLADKFSGLPIFERGRSLQMAMESLFALYMDSVKFSLFPPLMIDKDGAVPSTITYAPGAKWIVNQPNAIQQMQISPRGMETFQTTYTFMKAAQLGIGGSTDTSISKNDDAAFGKTPQALMMQQEREGARDNLDRSMMEKCIEHIVNKMINMLATKQEKPITLELFRSDIEKLVEAYPDENIVDFFQSGEFGRVKIEKKRFQNDKGAPVKFRFYVDSGTTMKKAAALESETLQSYMEAAFNPKVVEALAMGGFSLNVGELFKRDMIAKGLQDYDKILVEKGMSPEAEAGIGPDGLTVPEAQPMPPEQGMEMPMEDPAQYQQMPEMPQEVPQMQ